MARSLVGAESFEQLAGHAVFDFFRPEQREQAAERISAAMAGNRLPVREAKLLRLDGQEVPVEFHSAPIDFQGARAVQTIIRDVTERRRAEDSLRRSEERFRVAQELSLDGFTILTAVRDDSGRIVDFRWEYVNPEAGRILRHAPAELVGRRLLEVLPGNKTDSDLFDRYVRVVETGQPHDYELCYQSEDIRGWFRNMTVKLGDGVAICFADITERKRVEGALRELNATLEHKVIERMAQVTMERQRLYDVLEILPAMICLLTPDYHVAFANRSFREKFGDSHGRRRYDFCFGRRQPCEFCETYTVLKTGQPHHWEVTSPDGGTIIDAYDFPFTDVDGSPLILEMDIDITERKRTEAALKDLNGALTHRARQLQKLTLELSRAEDRERKRIAAILHEDLQQHIAAAKFHLSLLRSRVKHDPPQRAIAERVDELLKEAIQKSRGLSHDLSPAVLHMNDIAEVLQWLAGRMQANHGLAVQIDVRGERTLQSEAPTMFLFRATQEMLSNVVKHAEVQEAVIRVRRMGRYVSLSVSDRGCGFDPQELRETSGFGLLGIRERVELLGGRMKIKSIKGRGSRFHIVVPDGELS